MDRPSQADLIAAGEGSLKAGEWTAARNQFQKAIELGESGNYGPPAVLISTNHLTDPAALKMFDVSALSTESD